MPILNTLPYGAQLLMAAGLAYISPMEIIPCLYYPFAIGIIGNIYILQKRDKKKKNEKVTV